MSTLTLEAYKDMPDAGKNEAVARARGWVPCKCPLCDGDPHVLWNRIGPPWQGHCNLPEYITAGDSDPFANWDLLAGVWRLCGRNAVLSGPFPTHPATAWGVAVQGGAAEATTPHRAACLAAVAAGLVLKEGA